MSTKTDHNTDYTVYQDADKCKCVVPEDEASDEYAQWDDSHPWGEGVGGWEGRICHDNIEGTFCEECSQDQGDWFGHIQHCEVCEYPLENDGTCQCEPVATK